jgi:hypothetical protein
LRRGDLAHQLAEQPGSDAVGYHLARKADVVDTSDLEVYSTDVAVAQAAADRALREQLRLDRLEHLDIAQLRHHRGVDMTP